jgi:hypothetical protein
LLAIGVTLCGTSPSGADNVAVARVGAYAEIDTRPIAATIQVLAAGTSEEKAKLIAAVKTDPQNYAPPTFYALSKALFDEGHKDEGAFWFYAGQLRGRFDANRCTDATAAQAIDAFNDMYGEPINQYMFKDLPKLEALIAKVVEWDRKTPHRYDPHWINLSGMKAMTDSMSGKSTATLASMSAPETQWAQIAEQTRAEYLAGFKSAVAELKTGNH